MGETFVMLAKKNVTTARYWLTMVAVAAMAVGFPVAVFAGTAAASTYSVSNTSLCGGAGSFEQALRDANTNPGPDTITFTPGLVVDAFSCTTPGLRPFPFATFATESVTIVGNGATIEGNQLFMAGNGVINGPTTCPGNDPTTLNVRITFGFIQIGTYEADNSAIAVSIESLTFHNMPTLAKVEKNASLTMTDSTGSEIMDFNGSCNRSAIQGADGANVTLVRTQIFNSTMPHATKDEYGVAAVVAGDGNLVLDRVFFANNDFERAVSWFGGTTKIVSSRFVNSGGLVLNADTTSVVNSALFLTGTFGQVMGGSQAPTNRIMAFRGQTQIEASTFYWADSTCSACSTDGMGFWITNPAATVSFRSSAIGTPSPLPNSGPLLLGYNGTGVLNNNFDSDGLTWVQPTVNQDAADLAAVLPNVLTDPPGLTSSVLSPVLPYTTVLTPLLGTTPAPGVLLDAVPDAQCTAANQLVNPIDSSCLTTDVFGNPRVDAGNNKRDIGAVQTSQSPFLAVTSVTADVGLGWNRPPDPLSGAITGYRVTSVPVAGGSAQSIDVDGADSTSTTITGLTVGVPYRLTIAPLNITGSGTPSNEVQATPLGAVGSPSVTATAGDASSQVFWTEPTLGGRPGPASYFVVYRPTGTTTWSAGPGPLSARITTIPGLLNGTTYDVGVVATSADGTAGLLATTTVTPVGPPAAPVLTATAGGPGTGQIGLSWTRPADGGSPITDYLAQCRPSSGSASWSAYPTTGLATTLTITGLQSGMSVECQVAAANLHGAGPWSSGASATPPAVTPTTTPSSTTSPPSSTTSPSPATVTLVSTTTALTTAAMWTTDGYPPATVPSGGGTLANTGFDAVAVAPTGIALVVGGFALVVATRRRPRQPRHR